MGELLLQRPRRLRHLPRKADGRRSAAWADLFADTFSVIAWRRNSQLKAGRLTAQQYLSLSHVSTSIGPNTPAHIEQESLDRLGMNRNIAVYAPNFTSIAEVVLGTDYIATMHTRSARILAERMDIVVDRPADGDQSVPGVPAVAPGHGG